MYSIRTLFTQKPATISATIGAGITAYQLIAGDNSIISDRAAVAIVGFLGLLFALFWIDPSTVNVNTAEGAKDEAFLAGLALPNTDKAAAAVKAVAKKPAKKRARGAAGAVEIGVCILLCVAAFVLGLLCAKNGILVD